MKGIICYYSSTGNTKLTAQYLAHTAKSISFTLCDIAKESHPDFEKYDIVGFATFVDYGAPPQLFYSFIESLPQTYNKPAFILLTYGAFAWNASFMFQKLVSTKGFTVFARHALHTPESFPMMITKGMTYENAPNENEFNAFKQFIDELNTFGYAANQNNQTKHVQIKNNPLVKILPTFNRTKARRNMGLKYVDDTKCTKCKICEKECPYNAITCDPTPVFDMEKCYGCWACFHKCPEKAIYTKKFKDRGHYSGPGPALKKKLTLT